MKRDPLATGLFATMKNDTKEVGARIKAARQQAGMTQRALADALHIAAAGVQRISNWEMGEKRPKHDAILRIAAALHVSPRWIEYEDR